MLTASLIVERSPGIAWMKMNRPDSLNAINSDMLSRMNTALSEFEADPSLRVVVLTATGKAFCSGADLKEGRDRAAAGNAEGSKAFLEALRQLTVRLSNFPVPVLAAVNGTTAGGGLELLLCCDLAIAARSARVGDAHANYGLLPGGGGSARLPRRIGIHRAKYMMYTGQLFDSELLQDWGLFIDVVDDEKLLERAAEIAARIGSKSPLGLRRMKQLVDDGMEQSLNSALNAELTMCALHARSFDQAEGLSAFNAKRKPVFEGR